MRRLAAAAAVLAVVAGFGVHAAPASADEEHRRIHFPTEGPVRFSDDFGDPRSGGRSHEGNDLMGAKMQKLLAAADGTVSVRLESEGSRSGNMITVTDSDGWRYVYIHVNNDTPGTDDGAAGVEHVVAPGVHHGARVRAGQVLGYMGDSGNAEGTAPHLHFEIRRPDRSALNPWASLRLAQGLPAGTRCGYDENPRTNPDRATSPGYWALGGDGGVFTFGAAPYAGSTGGMRLNKPVVDMAATRSGRGYWSVATDGGVFAFGDAGYHGSTGGLTLNQPVVGMAATVTGLGYWLVASDGGVFAFGDAAYHGSTGGLRLNRPIVAMVATPTGGGYWLVGDDGGIFAFGDAGYHGSLPGLGITGTVSDVAATVSGRGYWLLGADGGVFTFGDAVYRGSPPGVGLCRPPRGVDIAATPSGRGYWVLGDDASVWAFGDAAHSGAPNALGLVLQSRVISLVPQPVPSLLPKLPLGTVHHHEG